MKRIRTAILLIALLAVGVGAQTVTIKKLSAALLPKRRG